MEKLRRTFRIATISLSLALVLSAFADRDVAITVHNGATHTWKGFGASILCGRWGVDYSSFSDSGKKKLNSMLVDSCNMRLFMVGWLAPSNLEIGNPGVLLSRAKAHYDDLRALSDDLVMLQGLAPLDGTSGFSYENPQQWAALAASVIKGAWDNDNIRIDATELCNEPQAHNPPLVPLADYPAIIKYMRTELNSRGLDDVKIVAPSHCNVEWKEINRLGPVFDDPQALNALDVYGFHSYYMAMRKDVRDALYSHGIKEFWVTEGGTNAIKLFFPVDKDTALYDAGHVGNWLADINLGSSYYRAHEAITVWDHVTATGWKPGMTRANYWWLTSDANGDVKCFKKYYYAKQFSRGIGVNAQVRLCSSNLPGGDHFKWMQAQYGARPHMYACAAQNTDHTWGISLINVTGSPPMKWKSDTCNSFPSAENLSVTVTVEELSGAGEMEFDLFRTGVNTVDEKQTAVTMNNGKLTIALVPGDMVTLRSKSGTAIAEKTAFEISNTTPSFDLVRLLESDAARLTIQVPEGNGVVPVSAQLFDGRGRTFGKVLKQRVLPGVHAFTFNKTGQSTSFPKSGFVFLKVTMGQTSIFKKILVR